MSKGIAQVIKYEGDNTTFVWKHPTEDFNIGSQLIVHESQEALFYRNGQALDLFGPGRHTLETMNLPIVGQVLNKVMGDESPFHCEVYFINKTEQLAIKWGTDSKLEYVEPAYGFPIQIGASGEMSLSVADSRKLLVKIVGTEQNLTQAKLVAKFRMFLTSRLKPYLAQLIKTDKINIFEIDERLATLSETMHQKLTPDFSDYGMGLERFFITTIVKPEDDGAYRKFKELHFRQYADVAEAKLRQQVGVIDEQTKAQRMVIEAEGLSSKRSIEGYTYQQERSFDVAERVAANEGVGEFSNMGIGLGMVAGVGGAVGGSVGDMMQGAMSGVAAASPDKTKPCAQCGKPLVEGAKFCLECGEAVAQPGEKTCPACGENTPEGKFCMKCGASLAPSCPSCGKELPAGAKFCLECGEKL